MTPLFPSFARDRGRVINYPPLIPPFARGDTGGGKKLTKLVLMKLVLEKAGNGEKEFLQGNTIVR